MRVLFCGVKFYFYTIFKLLVMEHSQGCSQTQRSTVRHCVENEILWNSQF